MVIIVPMQAALLMTFSGSFLLFLGFFRAFIL